MATTYRMQQQPVSGMQQAPVSGMQQAPLSGMQQVPVSGMQQGPVSGMQQVPVSGMQQVHVSGMQQVPEGGYAMSSITAPQQPQQPPPQQQQPQQQQFIHANPQYVPVQTYYQVPQQVQQSQPFDPSLPMYYVSVHPNQQPVPPAPLPKVAPKPEVQSNLYRPVAPQPQMAQQPQMVHMAAPGAEQGYHVLHHHHPSQAPAPAQPMANYVYYTQTTTMTPSMPGQYQTVISDATQPTVEMKQNRSS